MYKLARFGYYTMWLVSFADVPLQIQIGVFDEEDLEHESANLGPLQLPANLVLTGSRSLGRR